MTIFSYCPRLYSIKSRRKNDLNPPRSFDHETSHTPSDRMGRRFVGRNPSFMWSKSCPNLQHLDDALIPGRVVALLEQSKRQTVRQVTPDVSARPNITQAICNTV
jgi:hypothetical protein